MKKKKKAYEYKVLPDGKKALNTEVINYDFLGQKNTIGTYIGYTIAFIAIILLGIFVHPLAFLLLLWWTFSLKKTIKKDIRRKNLRYDVTIRLCTRKEYIPDSEYADSWEIYFINKSGTSETSISVTEEFYNKIEMGDNLYLVYSKDEGIPCLWYSEKEWQLVPDM